MCRFSPGCHASLFTRSVSGGVGRGPYVHPPYAGLSRLSGPTGRPCPSARLSPRCHAVIGGVPGVSFHAARRMATMSASIRWLLLGSNDHTQSTALTLIDCKIRSINHLIPPCSLLSDAPPLSGRWHRTTAGPPSARDANRSRPRSRRFVHSFHITSSHRFLSLPTTRNSASTGYSSEVAHSSASRRELNSSTSASRPV